jgi:hypothetical protein
MIKIQTHGIEAFVKSLGRKSKETQRHLGQATVKAVQVVGRAAEARIIIPSQRSGQDDPSIPGSYRYKYMFHPRSPVAQRADTVEAVGYVIVAPHWTSARTPGIRRVFGRLGLAHELERKSLWLQARKPAWVKINKDFLTENQLKRWRRSINSKAMKERYLEGLVRQRHDETDRLLGFQAAPRLSRWAQRKDREQYRRHAIRLSNPDARRRLILQPAVDRNLEDIINLYRWAAATGIAS